MRGLTRLHSSFRTKKVLTVVFALVFFHYLVLQLIYKTAITDPGNLNSKVKQKFTSVFEKQNLANINQLQIQKAAPVDEKETDASNDDKNIVWKRFQLRLRRVKDQCSILKPSYEENWKKIKTKFNRTANDYLIGSYPHHVINCMVLKSGSSTWHDLFWKIRAPEESKRFPFWERAVHGNRMAFQSMELNKTLEIWNHEKGAFIVTVRHPMARLISGYRDKLNKYYYYVELFKLYPDMKKYPSQYGKWNQYGYFMEWEDFMEYVADYGSKDSKKYLDEHFQPIVDLCDPCSFPFNFIAKLETFDEDSRWLLEHKFNLANTTLNKVNNAKAMKSTTDAQRIKQYFSRLKPGVVKKINEIYKNDLLLFGYTFNILTLEVGGFSA